MANAAWIVGYPRHATLSTSVVESVISIFHSLSVRSTSMRGVKPSGRTALAVCMAMVIMSSTAIALRFIVKVKIKKGVAVEDWCIITAFVLLCAYEGVFLGGKPYPRPIQPRLLLILKYPGLVTSGGSLVEITLAEYENFLKVIATEPAMFFKGQYTQWLNSMPMLSRFSSHARSAIKMSILFFYCTIFTTKAFRCVSFAVGILCLIWAVVCLLISVF